MQQIFFFGRKKPLQNLIRTYTFINFWDFAPSTIFRQAALHCRPLIFVFLAAFDTFSFVYHNSSWGNTLFTLFLSIKIMWRHICFNMYAFLYAFSDYLSGQNWLNKTTYFYLFLSIIISTVAFNLFAFVYNLQVKSIFAHQELFFNGLFYLLVLTGMYIVISMHFQITFLVKTGSTSFHFFQSK